LAGVVVTTDTAVGSLVTVSLAVTLKMGGDEVGEPLPTV
jgi:hypothetical protein